MWSATSGLVEARLSRGERPALLFWRDSNGSEVDVIADVGTGLMPIEVKSGQTVHLESFAGLPRWSA